MEFKKGEKVHTIRKSSVALKPMNGVVKTVEPIGKSNRPIIFVVFDPIDGDWNSYRESIGILVAPEQLRLGWMQEEVSQPINEII